jgi:hypothetical protein
MEAQMRSTDMTPDQTEANGRWLLPALESIAGSSTALARDAERHTVRLRFALARVGELRERVAARRSALDAGRLDVAHAILATHYRNASSFVSTVASLPDSDAGTRAASPISAARAVPTRHVATAPVATDDSERPASERIAA